MTPILLTLALLHGADLASTQVVLHQGGWLLHRIGRSHPRLATVIGIAAIGAEGLAVVHNVRQAR
jgi:hypothetical protein